MTNSNILKRIFTMRVVKYWKRLPRGATAILGGAQGSA